MLLCLMKSFLKLYGTTWGTDYTKEFSLTEKINDFGNCLKPADIMIAISDMICQFVQMCESSFIGNPSRISSFHDFYFI